MSDLSSEEQQVFEKLFKMEEGNLLNLTTADVGDFFDLNAGIQIHSKPFNEYGFSVGDKIKAFWKIAPNRCVAQINRDLLGLAIRRNKDISREDLQQAEKILHRLETIDEEPKKESNKPSTKKIPSTFCFKRISFGDCSRSLERKSSSISIRYHEKKCLQRKSQKSMQCT